MTLTAIISTPVTSVTATLDSAIVAKAKLNLYELALANGFVGTFDDFMASIQEPYRFISADPNNDLKLGSDNKLIVATDELNTSFNYASSVSTFWSI